MSQAKRLDLMLILGDFEIKPHFRNLMKTLFRIIDLKYYDCLDSYVNIFLL